MIDRSTPPTSAPSRLTERLPSPASSSETLTTCMASKPLTLRGLGAYAIR